MEDLNYKARTAYKVLEVGRTKGGRQKSLLLLFSPKHAKVCNAAVKR